jgi:hypothetical protein
LDGEILSGITSTFFFTGIFLSFIAGPRFDGLVVGVPIGVLGIGCFGLEGLIGPKILGIGFLTPFDGVRGSIGFLEEGFFFCAITFYLLF